jgi:hypothetical protein
LQFKVAYWGPGESGKTTNYLWLKRRLAGAKVSEGFSIQTSQKRTLWNDSVFLKTEFDVGAAHFITIWQVVTATGQERFLATREFVLAGADGAVFVADASPGREGENRRSFQELLALTRKSGIPIVVQLNKTDIEGATSAGDLANLLGIPEESVKLAVAVKGQGVEETFSEITGTILQGYFARAVKASDLAPASPVSE